VSQAIKSPDDRGNQHAIRCAICQSDKRQEFNSRFIAGESTLSLASEMGFAQHTAERHVQYYRLLEERYKSVRGALQRFLAHCEWLQRQGKLAIKASAYVTALKLMADLNRETREQEVNVTILNNLPKFEEILKTKDVGQLRNRLAELSRTGDPNR